jgi:hypothetical protein
MGQTRKLLALTKNRRHHARIAAAIEHGDHEERLMIGRVSNEVIVYRLKTKRT